MAKKKHHPADAADRAAIETATSFAAHLRLSPTSKITEGAATLADAVAKADAIRAAHPGRNAIVYAVTPAGASIPVPKDLQDAAREEKALEPAAVEKKPPRVIGKRAQIEAAASGGGMPPAPDFSAETHKRFRKKLAEIVTLIEAGDIDGLKAIDIKPISSSPKAMDKFRNLAVMALEARRQKAAS